MIARLLLFLVTLFWLASACLAQTAGERPPPQGFALAPLSGSGQMLSTRLTGDVKSALALAKGVVPVSGEYFDGPPALTSGVANADDSVFQAAFTASIAGEPYAGIIVASRFDGGGEVVLVFDRPEQLNATLASMNGASGGGEASAYANVPRQQFTAPDGSTRITLPSGWNMLYGQNGAVDFAGPNGEGGSLGASLALAQWQAPFMEPLQAYQAWSQSNPQGFQVTRIRETAPTNVSGIPALFIFADGTLGGRPYTEFCLMATQNMGEQWFMYRSNVGAPAESFKREFKTLMEVWGSWGIDPSYTQRVLKEAMGKMREASNLMTEASENRSDAVSRGSKAWSLTIRGNDIVENTQTGTRYELPDEQLNSLVQGLNDRDGANAWRIVPMGEY